MNAMLWCAMVCYDEWVSMRLYDMVWLSNDMVWDSNAIVWNFNAMPREFNAMLCYSVCCKRYACTDYKNAFVDT